VSLPEKLRADYVMVVLLPKKKKKKKKKKHPLPPAKPKSCFPGNSLQAWLPRGDFFSRRGNKQKSHL
jgi:hypothetical protein